MTAAPGIELPRPDDFHLHLRDGALLRAVVPWSARQFGRALIMPNLAPPVTTVEAAAAYRKRILEAVPAGVAFEPLMTLYLTDETAPAEIRRARESGFVLAAKLYPAGATTHSDAGVTRLEGLGPVLAAMEEHGLVLSVHGEVTEAAVDIFDREAKFLETRLGPLLERHPRLRMVLEHVTTAEGVAFVRAHGERVAGTLTPQHLLLNRNDLLVGGVHPHHYCLPVLKRDAHRRALVAAVASGDPSFFAGTDSAPHPRDRKESHCGCAGCFSAPSAVELYAEAFAAADALPRLAAFLAEHGARFYGLPPNSGSLWLERVPREVPAEIAVEGEAPVVPLRAGTAVAWRLGPGRGDGYHQEGS